MWQVERNIRDDIKEQGWEEQLYCEDERGDEDDPGEEVKMPVEFQQAVEWGPGLREAGEQGMRKLQASDCALGTVGELLLAVEAHCRGGDEDGVAEPSGG